MLSTLHLTCRNQCLVGAIMGSFVAFMLVAHFDSSTLGSGIWLVCLAFISSHLATTFLSILLALILLINK